MLIIVNVLQLFKLKRRHCLPYTYMGSFSSPVGVRGWCKVYMTLGTGQAHCAPDPRPRFSPFIGKEPGPLFMISPTSLTHTHISISRHVSSLYDYDHSVRWNVASLVF